MQQRPRPVCRRLVSALALGASCLAAGACTQTPAAQSADSAGAALAAETEGAQTPGTLTPQFAAVMPRGLTTPGVATLGDALYIVGGYFGSPHEYSKEYQSGKVHRLQLSTGVWEDLPGVDPIQSPAVIGDGRYLYKLGGLKALNAEGKPTELRSVADAERFDPATNRWEPIASLPEPRSSTYAVVVDHTLYVVGGWSLAGGMYDNTWSDTMLTMDLSQPTLSWNSVKMPFQIRAHGLVPHKGKIYVLGGINPESSTDAVHRYDIATGQWSDGPSFPQENITARGAEYKGQLIVNGADGIIYRLSADESQWERAGSVAIPRLFHEIVPSEHGPLVLAGIPDNNRGGRIRFIERLSDEPGPAGVIMNVASDSPAKNRQGMFLWSQQLFAFGGNNSLGQHDFEKTNFVNDGVRFDLGALEWRPVPALPAARQSMQALVYGKEEAQAALMIGGFGFGKDVLSSHADVFRYDIMKKEWAPAADKALPPEGRSQFGLATWKDTAYVVGGLSFDGKREQQDQIKHTAQILKLDLNREGAKFEDAGFALSTPRRAFAGASIEGTYFIVGGLSDNFQPVTGCESLDLEAKRAQPMPCPSEHRLGAEMVALGGKLYLIGGSVATAGGQREPSNAIDRFDPASAQWTRLPSPQPLDTAEQLRAFNFKDQILLYSAQRSDATVQIALLDPEALATGRQNYARVNVQKPVK